MIFTMMAVDNPLANPPVMSYHRPIMFSRRPRQFSAQEATPGDASAFSQALTAIEAGEHSLPRYLALRQAPLPPAEEFTPLFATLSAPVRLLLCWLRADVRRRHGSPALAWMRASNTAAAATVYADPPWWEAWRREELPAARQALGRLESLPVSCDDGDRTRWITAHLLPDYARICVNLLLAQAAESERVQEIVEMAAAGHLPAVRALGMLTAPGEDTITLLQRLRRTGGRPAQAAATAALERLARRQGLSGADELERQGVLAAAWELGPLAGARVRVGWDEGSYRIRLGLHAGEVRLEVLGPGGPLARVPAELRQSTAYHDARAAQTEIRKTYRQFRDYLERYLLEERPLPAGEFRYLLRNPIFAHLAERLVWRNADGTTFLWAGPERWETLNGVAVEPQLSLLPVHPVALAADGTLLAWQHLAADRRLVQPFRQLFREVYLLGEETGDACRRFAGRRIDPARAYALLRAAHFAPGNGAARLMWPGGVTACLCWADGAVGHDLFGANRLPEVRTGGIWFTRGTERLPLHAVPPILFSETLRAADLLTTRAAVGDADLTSVETLALRALLLREMARSFRLTNVVTPEDGRYALVLGKRATYRVNLMSGTVLLEPEGRQIVLPPHPARWQPAEGADTAGEVIATVLALAHDGEISDLTFLAQL